MRLYAARMLLSGQHHSGAFVDENSLLARTVENTAVCVLLRLDSRLIVEWFGHTVGWVLLVSLAWLVHGCRESGHWSCPTLALSSSLLCFYQMGAAAKLVTLRVLLKVTNSSQVSSREKQTRDVVKKPKVVVDPFRRQCHHVPARLGN